MIQEILPIMPHRFSNDLFALKKSVFCTLKIYQAIKYFEFQAFNEHSTDKLIVAYIFEIQNKKLGSVI